MGSMNPNYKTKLLYFSALCIIVVHLSYPLAKVWWFFELFTHYIVYYFLATTILLFLTILKKKKILSAILGLLLVFQLTQILPYYFTPSHPEPELLSSSRLKTDIGDPNNQSTLTVLSYNFLYINDEVEDLKRILDQEKPDVWLVLRDAG